MYDAVIVGGRLAGAATATHLGKQGRRVLLLERDTFPKDVLSTHFMWPRGVSYLNRLGVLAHVVEAAPLFQEIDLAVEGVHVRGSVREADLRARFSSLHGDDTGVVNASLSARRDLLDALVLRHAAASGVEVQQGALMTELVQEDGRVVGVRWRQGVDGPVNTARASVVVGADGRRSRVARLVGAEQKDVRRNCSFACYTYLSGHLLTVPALQRRGRFGVALSPTSGEQTMALVFGPREWYPAFRSKAETHFTQVFERVAPDLAAVVNGATRASGLFMTNDQSAFIRETAGNGWVLAGDAASFKDQCTASGMTHALRDAELLTEIIGPALGTGGDLDGALSEYRERRHMDSWKYYDFVSDQAEMRAPEASEVDLIRAVAADPEHSATLLGVFSDTLDPEAIFSVDTMQHILSTADQQAPVADPNGTPDRNPFVADTAHHEELALTHTVRSFASPSGGDLLERVEPFHRWYRARVESETWLYSRTLASAPRSTTRLLDTGGRELTGINLASQDYLGLSSHPEVIRAAADAIAEYGVHSAGSAAAIGNTTHSRELEQSIAEFIKTDHVVLFPTGWAAAYGPVNALVRHYDHVILDRFAHASLVQAAHASSRNVQRVPHLDTEAVHAVLRKIRERDAHNGVLVITEGLFSMDADSPDLVRLQETCHEHSATLLVDVAHDLGSTGPGGQGQLGIQRLVGRVDLVMGSFSKSFASNGGFVATSSPAVKSYIETYGSTHVFSNALSPAQAAAAGAAMRIAMTSEGDRLRERTLCAATALREALLDHGLVSLGAPGPIVPVVVGDERVARLTHRGLRPRGVAAMVVEYPVVPSGSARLRLQVMPTHTTEQVEQAAAAIADATAEARAAVDAIDSSAE
ncbi:aminotransferase class I/II-fold pyridoxal phosphate-dependent enzyme [Streptomyces sp. NPDC059176]|uniref:aminotransferase class I/II-fold pyridoxal phosphate-dependent enzyme n=1 Tax=unclassified Streptomyces TaxID=2593676 RepID=UPI003677EF72